MKKGFTLIELLIVIAIILILIAIALPNFLEAQIRAKVANAQAEMRGLEPAIASYLQDWRRYPRDGFELPGISGFYPEENPRIWVQLTTPNAYLSQLPVDEFYVALSDTSGNVRDPSHQTYRYYEAGWRCRASGNSAIPGFPPGQPERCQLVAGAKGRIDPSPFDPDAAYVGKWVLYSPGPDNLHSYGEWAMYRPNLVTGGFLYSPTNGTKSVGDLVRWGT